MIGSLTPQCHTELAFYALHDVAFHVNYHVSPLIGNISRLNRIATLLARCLRLAPTITDDSSRLATVGWLNLNQTGFPPARLIALSWAHNSNVFFPELSSATYKKSLIARWEYPIIFILLSS